jgi:hypothetical protein
VPGSRRPRVVQSGEELIIFLLALLCGKAERMNALHVYLLHVGIPAQDFHGFVDEICQRHGARIAVLVYAHQFGLHVRRPVGASSAAPSITGWDSSEWTLNEKERTISHTATDIGLYSVKPATGDYLFSGIFTHQLLFGWQKVQWVVGYHDTGNYLLFTLSHDSLTFTSVSGGKKSPSQQFPVPVRGAYQVLLHVGADEVSVSLRDGDRWNAVHAWKALNQNLSEGGFGFKDAVTLTSFSYSTRAN